MKLNLDLNKNLNFYEFISNYLKKYSNSKNVIANCLQFTENEVKEAIDDLTKIEIQRDFAFTKNRLNFTIKLIMKRLELLKKELDI